MAKRFFVGMDDTDTLGAPRGTGKLARWFEGVLPEGCTVWGVVRQQLLVHKDVPYTSHNSAACIVVDAPDHLTNKTMIDLGAAHLEEHSLDGSDPGLCVACLDDPGLARVVGFGRACSQRVVSQDEALEACQGLHLSAHGGTGDGVIGAAAAVGLTFWGWAGRFIEFGGLRNLPDELTVAELEENDILVSSVDRDASLPGADDMVKNNGWCRPRLMGGRAVLMVTRHAPGMWYSLGRKRKKSPGHEKGDQAFSPDRSVTPSIRHTA